MPLRSENNTLFYKRKFFLHTCPLCEGTGKIPHQQQGQNDTGSYVSEVEEEVCPLCDGSGAVRLSPRHRRRRSRLRGRWVRLKSRSMRGSRRVARLLRFPWDKWGHGWPEEDMELEPEPVLGAPFFDAEQNIKPANFKENIVRESVLSLSDDVTLTFESKLGLPEVVLDTEHAHSRLLESKPILLTDYGLLSEVYQDMFDHLVYGPVPPFIVQPPDGYSPYGLNNLSVEIGEPEMFPVDPGLMLVPDSNVAPSIDVQVPDTRLDGATFTSVVSPQMPGGPNHLDITGFQDPIGFDLNTNIVGPPL